MHSSLLSSPVSPLPSTASDRDPAGVAAERTLAVGDVRDALAEFRANPENTAAQTRLTETLRAASALIAHLPRKDTQSPLVADVLQLMRDVSASGAHDRHVEPVDLAEADALSRRGWQGLLAAMLLTPAWQWANAPLLLTAPEWLRTDFVAWLFAAPQGFCAVGDAEKYAAYVLSRLEELVRWVNRCPGAEAELEVLTTYAKSSAIPLYLAGGSLRRHAELRGRLLTRAFRQPDDGFEVVPQSRVGRRLRVGLVHRQFGPLMETYTTLPIFEQLDPDRFEVILYAQRSGAASLEDHCRQHSANFVLLPEDVDSQLMTLRMAELDVVVFCANLTAECDELTRLALHRVGPLQIAHHGSFITTGLPEIDLYVSGEYAELPRSPEDYVERLGLLPGAAHAFNFEVDRQEPASSWTRAALGLPEGAIVFSTAADYTRIPPEAQQAWARLLSAVPDSRLLLHPFGIDGSSSSTIKRFSAGFDRVLAQHGVADDRLVISTCVLSSRADLRDLLRVSDIYLDSPPCCEVGALVDSLACGLPVVTCEGDAARSRAGAAVLRTLQLDELVAAGEPQYHDLAVQLAGDATRRAELRARIEDRLARSPVLFDTLAASDAFGALVETAFDAMLACGLKAFRADRTPVRAATITDLAPAESALASGAASQAASHAQAVLARDPANPQARRLLGVAWLRLGRPERASRYLLEAVQQLENDAPAWCDLARAFHASGQSREATQAVEVCLRIDGQHLEALLLLGEIAAQTGQLSDLAEVVELARSVAPQDPRVLALAAQVRAGSVTAPAAPLEQPPKVELPLVARPTLTDALGMFATTSLELAQRGGLVPAAAPVIANPQGGNHRPNPRALLFFLSAKETYRQPLFSSEEIFCGPDTDARAAAGRVQALRTPAGSFDVRDVLRALPASQQPEIVIVKADATGRNFPRNLAALRCPKVLLVGDTHHMAQPLSTVIEYARSEPFDFIIFDHTRHHARFFAEAGVHPLYWLPAVDYGYVERQISAAPTHPLTFVGQVGHHHPWRRAVLAHVKAAGLPLETFTGTLEKTASLYADSQVTLNVSLNGDLNLRVFESLAAGGFLLTDELSEASGLRLLFEPGRHLDTWRTPGELVEKIQYYLAHPAEAQRLRRAGQAEIRRAHHPVVKLREFYDLVFSGQVNPLYSLALDQEAGRAVVAKAAPAVARRREAYETLQSLHQVSGEVTVFCREPAVLADLANLPRLRFAALAELALLALPTSFPAPVAHVLWWEGGAAELAAHLARFTGSHVVAEGGDGTVGDELAAWGYAAVAPDSWVYVLANPLQALCRAGELGAHDAALARFDPLLANSQDSAQCLELAAQAEALGDASRHRAALEKAVGLDRNNQAALLTLAALSLDHDQPASTLLLLEEAARVSPLPPGVEDLRVSLATQVGEEPAVKSYHSLINCTAPAVADTPRRILVVTNLLPPQELGGYGRSIWEFAQGLRVRGHEVRVLAGNLPEFTKPPTPAEIEFESCVSRRLELMGTWVGGRASPEKSPAQLVARDRANIRLIQDTIRDMGAEAVLMGNLDFLGIGPLNTVLKAGLPVVHSLGNAAPGYGLLDQPTSPRYCIGPCSAWTGGVLRQAGYQPARMEVLYPGARLDQFFRLFLPDSRRLRLCYASLVLPYKGAHTLVEALAILRQRGVDFTAEIAGDAPDEAFLNKLRDFAQRAGIDGQVRFTGFLDRAGLSSLFARNNVLVFPSQFEEPFGISQVEALAAGLVVVTSGTGGAREIVRDGVDGVQFPANNPAALADRLQALASQPTKFAELQQNGQLRALEFSVDQTVKRIEQLFEELRQA